MELSQFIEEVLARGIWFNIGHWFVIIGTLVLGTLAYKRNSRNLNNRAFLFLNFSFSIWAISMYLSDFVFWPHEVVLSITRSTFSFGFILAIYYYRFCLIFPDQNRSRPWYYKPLITVNLIFALVSGVTDWLIIDFSIKNSFVFVAHEGFLVPFAVLFYALLAFGGSVILFSKVKSLKGKKRAQLQYVVAGGLLFVIYIFATDLIPQLIGITDYSRYGALGVIFFIAFTGYAVIKHRLMDIRLVVLKSAVYSVLIGFLAAGYVFSVFYLKKYYEKLINPDAVFIVASFAVAFGFQPLKRFLQKYADRIFAKGQYNFEELLAKISNILSSNLVLTSLAPDLLKTLSSELKVNKLAFYNDAYQESLELNLSAKDTKKLLNIEYIDTLVSDELEDDSPTKKLMQKLGIEVLVFFPDSENKPLGFLALSEKASGDAYTARDLKLLEIIAPQISIALKNIEQQQQMIENIVEERQRINQDAHDHIYNRLGALSKKAEVALLNPKETESTLNLLKSDLSQTVTDLQRIVSGEIEEDSKELPLLHELERICADFKEKTDIDLNCSFDKSFMAKLEPNCFWHLQCILEECLNNIQKHSKATEAKVSIKQNNGSLILQVTDNGKGFIKKDKTDLENHYGLKGMKQRAGKIGARLSITSNNGKGTKVELELPC